MKKDRKYISLVVIIFFVTIVCCISLVYNFIGGFYYNRVVSFESMLGQQQTINVSGEGIFICASNFCGSLVLNNEIYQPINVRAIGFEGDVYLRAKASISNLSTNVSMFGISNWVEGQDGYIYFNQSVKNQDAIQLCRYIKIESNKFLESNKNYIIVFAIESSQNNWEYEAK